MMKETVLKRLTLVMLIGVLLLVFQAVRAEPEEPAEPEAVAGYPDWTTAVEITKATYAPHGARLPVVASANNGTIMVGFLIQTIADDEASTDLYYRTSVDDGTTWSPGINSMPLPIHTSPARSTELDITYQGNNAHAVWREGDTEIHFARQNQWASNGSTILSNVTGSNAAVYAPRIVASTNNRLNVIWGEFNNGQYFLRFRRSLDGGNTFPVSSQLNRSNIAVRPAMVVSGNTVHLVWEEGILIPTISGARVYYARGTVNEGSNQVTWEGPIAISPVSSTPGIVYNAKQPDILLEGSSLHVTYANRLDVDEQFIGYLECAANCLATTSWQSTSNVSGQFVGVFADDPYDMAPTMGSINGCIMAYFHGILAGDTEQILGTNDCGRWATSPQDIVSPIQNRAINPRLKVHENWWVYLVYQEITVIQQGGNTEFLPPQIRFVRNDPAVYLPVIRKP